jgi:hypothetical protein
VSGPYVPAAVPYSPPPPTARPVRDTARDLRLGAIVVGVLALVGIATGIVWAAWSPSRPVGFHQDGGGTWAITESESYVAADGRYFVIGAVTGVLAALVLWTQTRLRGPIAVVALAMGCLIGAQLTRFAGFLAGGGSDTGPACVLYLPEPVRGNCIKHMHLSVHLPGLYVVSAAAAVLVYSLFAAFAVRDDLGRRDPVRLMMLRQRASVPDGAQPQDARRDGDGAGQA